MALLESLKDKGTEKVGETAGSVMGSIDGEIIFIIILVSILIVLFIGLCWIIIKAVEVAEEKKKYYRLLNEQKINELRKKRK